MITIIAAIADNNCIGARGGLPWRLSEDLAHFRKLTMGKVVVMGRKTWESLPAKFRPLPGRSNVVITRQTRYDVPVGVLVYPSVEEALARHPDVYVIGGADIYAQTLSRADRLEITQVHRTVEGDAFFPVITKEMWYETTRQNHVGFSFVTHERIQAAVRMTNQYQSTNTTT